MLSCSPSISHTRLSVRQVWYIDRLHVYKLITLRNLLLISVKASTFMTKGWNIFISMMMVVVLIGLWLDCSTRIMMVYTVDTGILKWMARAEVRMTPTIFSTTGVREETGSLSPCRLLMGNLHYIMRSWAAYHIPPAYSAKRWLGRAVCNFLGFHIT